MIKEHLDRIDDTFKRLDSDRNDIVTNILRSTNLEEELVDDLNTEFIKTIEEDIDSFDDETARRKIEEHRRRQIKLLEDMDADRLQKRSLLAQKLLQRQNKPAVDEQAQPQSVMKTDEYCKAIDKMPQQLKMKTLVTMFKKLYNLFLKQAKKNYNVTKTN